MSYKHELNLSDCKVKIKNLKAVLTHEGMPFQTSARLEDLKTLVLNLPESTTKNSSYISYINSEAELKTPPRVEISSTKGPSRTPPKHSDYTPERHPPKRLKRKIFSPLKKSSFKKGFTKCIESFKDLVNRVSGPKETSHTCSSSEDEPELYQRTTITNSFFKYVDEPTEDEIILC